VVSGPRHVAVVTASYVRRVKNSDDIIL
jgi:hypothetical protein